MSTRAKTYERALAWSAPSVAPAKYVTAPAPHSDAPNMYHRLLYPPIGRTSETIPITGLTLQGNMATMP